MQHQDTGDFPVIGSDIGGPAVNYIIKIDLLHLLLLLLCVYVCVDLHWLQYVGLCGQPSRCQAHAEQAELQACGHTAAGGA